MCGGCVFAYVSLWRWGKVEITLTSFSVSFRGVHSQSFSHNHQHRLRIHKYFDCQVKKYTKSIQGSSKVGLRLTPRYDNVLSRPTPCNSRHAVKRIRALHLHHDHNRDGYSKSRRRKVQANNSESPGPQLQTAAILRFATYMSITDFINLS